MNHKLSHPTGSSFSGHIVVGKSNESISHTVRGHFGAIFAILNWLSRHESTPRYIEGHRPNTSAGELL